MKTVFSTKLVHPRDKFDFWHSVACKNIVDHDSRPANRLSFEAEINTGSFGRFELILFHNSSMRVSHTTRHISHKVRTICSFVDRPRVRFFLSRIPAKSYSKLAMSPSWTPAALRWKILGVFDDARAQGPRRELEARIGKIRNMTARLIKPIRLEDSLTSSLSAKLPSLAGKMNPISEEMVGSHALDLVAVSLAMTMDDRQPRVSSGKALILLNIQSVIEARLSDPTLDAQAVAGAAGVSAFDTPTTFSLITIHPSCV